MKRQAVTGVELDCMEDPTQLWMEVLRRCLGEDLVIIVACIGVTRGHSRL